MGCQGTDVHIAGDTLLMNVQQLLAIWNKAKGKERDALLWGDEVRDTCDINENICSNILDRVSGRQLQERRP